jgi:peptidoglycan hydrolase-like protein with peptidoglycan-binding domain
MNHASTLTRPSFAVPRPRPLVLVVLTLLAVLLVAGPERAHAFKSVDRGDRGPRVATVQRVLGIAGDRQFGPATVRALKRFQRQRRLAPDGVVGRRRGAR